jgi:peroxiredoxin
MTTPPNAVAPPDDGAYDHLLGTPIPQLFLPSTTGDDLDVCDPAATYTVLFLYPMTGTPGRPLPEGWTEIPGAMGCTAQSCAYRDLIGEFDAVHASVRGISTQTPSEQAEFAGRELIPYPLLSDADLGLTHALALPTFSAGGKPRIKRASMIVRARRVVRILYPVPDPSANAAGTLAALADLARSTPPDD